MLFCYSLTTSIGIQFFKSLPKLTSFVFLPLLCTRFPPLDYIPAPLNRINLAILVRIVESQLLSLLYTSCVSNSIRVYCYATGHENCILASLYLVKHSHFIRYCISHITREALIHIIVLAHNDLFPSGNRDV